MTLNEAGTTPDPAQAEIQILVCQAKVATNLAHLAGVLFTLPIQAEALLDFYDEAHWANGGYAENDIARDIFIHTSTAISGWSEVIKLSLSTFTKSLEELAVIVDDDPSWSLMQGLSCAKIGGLDPGGVSVEKWIRLVERANRATKAMKEVVWPWDVQGNGELMGTPQTDDSGKPDFRVRGDPQWEIRGVVWNIRDICQGAFDRSLF